MQRVKGHGNPGGVRNGTETNEHENVNNWTHRVWPISSNYYGTSYPYATYCVGDASGNAWPASEPLAYVGNINGQLPPDAAAYGLEGVYNPSVGAAYAAAATAATYGHAAPNNGTYNYYPSATDYTAAAAVAAAAAARAPLPWNTAATAAGKPAYENYYEDPVAAAAALKTIDQRLQSLDMADTVASSKLYSGLGAGGGEKKTTTWASIAKQPAKPMPQASSSGSKKKGPGMPPPPMVPGRHNIDLNPWESKVSGCVPKAPPPPLIHAAALPPPASSVIAKTAVWNGPTLVSGVEALPPPPPLMHAACDLSAPPPHQLHAQQQQLPPPFDVSAPPPTLPRQVYAPSSATTVSPLPSQPTTLSSSSHIAAAPPPPPPQTQHQASAANSHHPASSSNSTASTSQAQQPASQPVPTTVSSSSSSSSGGDGGSGKSHHDPSNDGSGHSISNTNSSSGYCTSNTASSVVCSASSLLSSSSCSSTSSSSSSSSCSSSTRSPPHSAHSVVDKLRDKNNYNPRELELPAEGTRFFVIKSYSEDDVHRSIKYEIWCSTERGNKRLDDAYADQKANGGAVYLFFSVNGSGHFCGVAQMCSPVDYGASSSVWAQDKWKGQFGVRWVYVKDVPNMQLRHIRLENNENKPVTNSRDTQEVPYDKGLSVLKIIHAYAHTTSIFDDFTHYEKRQEEGDSNKRGGGGSGSNNGGGGGGGVLMQRGGPPPNRPNPFATRGSAMHKDREGGGGSSFSQMNQNRRGGRNNGNSMGFTNHRSNHSNMLRS